jgi:hypothetical protein
VLVVRLRASGPADQDQQADGLSAVDQGPRSPRAFSSDPPPRQSAEPRPFATRALGSRKLRARYVSLLHCSSAQLKG